MFYLIIFISSSFQFFSISLKGEIAPCNVPTIKSFVNSFNSIVLPSLNKLTSNNLNPGWYYYIELKCYFDTTFLKITFFLVWREERGLKIYFFSIEVEMSFIFSRKSFFSKSIYIDIEIWRVRREMMGDHFSERSDLEDAF